MQIINRIIKLVFSKRFVKFCIVGFSGVFVNLGMLMLLADVLSVQANLAAALAIWVSINSNFVVNEIWTFKDRRSGKLAFRWLRFHLVSIAGGMIQWAVFVGVNYAVAYFLLNDFVGDALVLDSNVGSSFLGKLVFEPPDVGYWKYFSQMVGIGVATLWNFFANLLWTWNSSDGEKND